MNVFKYVLLCPHKKKNDSPSVCLFVSLSVYQMVFFFIFHMLNGLGEEKTLIAFELTRSKAKVTRVKKVKMVSAYYLENLLSQSFKISHVDWFW